MDENRRFDVYKLLVEEVREARKARRELSNIFTTLNVAGVGALGFLANPAHRGAGEILPFALLFWMGFALILICFIWRMSNAYYSQMLNIKYGVIYEYERALGIDPIEREYKGLPRKGPFKWFGVERAMPVVFVIGYIVFLSYQITWPGFVEMLRLALSPVLSLVNAPH